MLINQLLIGTVIVILMVILHVSALVALTKSLNTVGAMLDEFRPVLKVIIICGFCVLNIVAIHTLELWSWAAVYVLVGEFSDFTQSLYFSAVTATTLGYGDIVLSEEWRLLSTFEAMSGLILFGVSTAFLIELFRRFLLLAE